jgi:phi13 family phage major tail protein|nr:MAG TPA: tail tube protein [Caudoviricetes sp.]
MSAAGKVCTGFSKPYVAKYSNDGGVVTYSGVMQLARGVSVSMSLNTTDDNTFYADNVSAETAPATFTGGTATLTVDGLLEAAEKFVLGLPEATNVEAGGSQVAVSHYGDGMEIPYVGVGFVVRYQSAGVITYAPVVLTKARFQQPGLDAATQEESIDWQTQELTVDLMRDDTTNHDWKLVGADQSTEAAAEEVLKAILGGAA